MTNREIAETFKQLAALLELHGENPFKIRSYSSAVRILRQQTTPITQMTVAQLENIKGIGKAVASKTVALVKTGTFPLLTEVLEKTPDGVVDLLKIKGLGAKKIKVLWQELGITSLGELLYACNENRLVSLKGFGAKTQTNVQQSVEYLLNSANKYRYASVIGDALDLIAAFNQKTGIERVSLTGAIRRKCAVVEQIALLIAGEVNIIQAICETNKLVINEKTEMLWKGKTQSNIPIHLHLSSIEQFAHQLFLTTATPAHLQQFTDHSPTTIDVSLTTEEDIYAQADLPYILPELREGKRELVLAQQNQLPKQLIEFSDIKGIIHAHSTYSDGAATLKEMATACQKSGFEYLAISDHSKSAFYAGGLTEVDIIRQQEEIDQLNEALAPFRIFKSIESDILSDGSLDYSDEVLSSFDLVIASVHSHLLMDEQKATKRLIKAIENPHTTILGHPTGRLLLLRKGYPIDYKKVIDACAANHVVIELNASPYRLDLDWTWIPYCLEKGVLISINPDAHSIQGIQDIQYGVHVARKGLLTKEHCLSAFSRMELEIYLKS